MANVDASAATNAAAAHSSVKRRTPFPRHPADPAPIGSGKGFVVIDVLLFDQVHNKHNTLV
jgi:hypothetical protein